MDAGVGYEAERDGHIPSKATAFVVNSRYAVIANGPTICAHDLLHNSHNSWQIEQQCPKQRFAPLLALSPPGLNLLGVSQGSQVLIYALLRTSLSCRLKGNGRRIHAIAFANDDSGLVGTGASDGSVCVWSLSSCMRPLYRLGGMRAKCRSITFHPSDSRVLAASFNEQVCIWQTQSSQAMYLDNITDRNAKLDLHWSLGETDTLVAISSLGSVLVWNAKAALTKMEIRQGAERFPHDNVPDLFYSYDVLLDDSTTRLRLGSSVKLSKLMGQSGLIVVPQHERAIMFYSLDMKTKELTMLWKLQVGDSIQDFIVSTRFASSMVYVLTKHGTKRYGLPPSVANAMGESHGEGREDFSIVPAKPANEDTSESVKMVPRSIAPNPSTVHLVKESMQASIDAVILDDRGSWEQAPQEANHHLQAPSLSNDDNDDSPMPFISPGIPARKFSFGTSTVLDESLHLPPRASFDSMPSTAAHDSDSDDETFGGHMHSSGTFLPGGVNVPLPRTCGATFSSNGQLLVFQTTRPRPASADSEEARQESHPDTRNQFSGLTNLFPRFGNLFSASAPMRMGSNASSTGTSGDQATVPHGIVAGSSFDKIGSWKSRTSPVKANFTDLPGVPKVAITVSNVQLIGPFWKQLAEQYRVFAHEYETPSSLCRHNAQQATRFALDTVADIWRSLALILDHGPVCRSECTDSTEHNFGFGRDGEKLAITHTVGLASLASGRSWATHQLFFWAERFADIQTLACMSAVLLGSPDLYACNADYLTTGSRRHESADIINIDNQRVTTPPAVAALREFSHKFVTLNDSPTKMNSSRGSSRAPSQPATPYLEPSSLTPPFVLPSVPRRSSRLSTSGSASPEHNRNSFGAAARFYAQSITDRIASYGSSPPLKKSSISPGNEMSTSLPSGSLNKTVSFASATNATADNRRTSSLALDDDEYDSERTIDDVSLPQTPKSNHGGVSFTHNEQDSFFEESLPQTGQSSPFDDLSVKCDIWRKFYAQWLRSHGMLIHATEFEKLSTGIAKGSAIPSSPLPTIFPDKTRRERRATCSICMCTIMAAEQLCPVCLHTTHPNCFEDLISVYGTSNFCCPTGCGCDCSATSSVSYSAFIHEDGASSVKDAADS